MLSADFNIEQNYKDCVAGTHFYLNKRVNCAGTNCFTLEEVERVIYVYNSLVRQKRFDYYDEATDRDYIALSVANLSGLDQFRVKTILNELYIQVQSGNITSSSCLRPVGNYLSIFLYSVSAVAVAGGGYYFFKNRNTKFIKKFKRKKNV